MVTQEAEIEGKQYTVQCSDGLIEQCADSTSPELTNKREAWGNKAEFLLTTVGLAVGLGNIWRFPYLCQKNGGGTFLIPFCIFLVIEGMPLFFIELGVGQRFRKTAVEVWSDMHTSLTGIGVSSMIVSISLCIYYIIVITWCVYYLYLSMTVNLPWRKENCANYITYMKFVNTDHNTSMAADVNLINNSTLYANWSVEMKSKVQEYKSCCIQDPTQYFWYEETLQVSKHIEDAGIGINKHLLCALVVSWILVYICIVRGIKSSGKAVYFTATFPYVVLLVLFFRGITLPGASDGIKAMFTPKWELLGKPSIWMDAATQIFFSLSLGFGALITFASYNPINNNIIRDAYIIVITDFATAIFGGIVVFSILGYRYHETGIPVTKGGSGPGLAFVTFSDVMLLMDVSPLWSILFFFMLILLGIDSEFGVLEGVIAPLYDLKLVKMKKFFFIPILILLMFLIDLSMVAGFGYYVFQIFDDYAVTIPLLVIALVQCIAIAWVYGTDKFADDIEFMTGKRPWIFWMFCWKYLSPLAVLAILVWQLVTAIQSIPKYSIYIGCSKGNVDAPWTSKREYPIWARCLAAVIVIGTILPIPFFLVKEWPVNWKKGFKKRFLSGMGNYMPDPSRWVENSNRTFY